jgi:hypothetical protein
MLEAGKDSSPALAIDGRRGLEVTWTFPASFPAGRATLDWSYQATGTLAVRGARGRLEQVVLPSDRMFQPAVSRIRVVVPLGMHVFEGTGIAEAGWTVSRTADGIVAERSNAPGGEAATIVAELGVDPARLIEPTWQRYADWAADLVPAFVAGGLFILVIGAGVLWIIRFQYPRRTASDADREERAAVRRGLRATGVVAVALAAVLAGVTWATLSHFGPWSQAVPLSVFVVGVVFLSVAERIV